MLTVARPAFAFPTLRELLTDRREMLFVAITLITMIVANLSTGWLSIGLYVVAFITGGWYGLLASIEALKVRNIEVDLLMILAALGAAAVGSPFEGALLLFLFSLSNVLQDYAIGRSRDAIRALMKLRPSMALIKTGIGQAMMALEDVKVADVMVIRPGDRIPLDGTVREGTSSIDESTITGESLPVDKGLGDQVFAGTINQTGALEVKVTRLANDSTIARLIKLVEDAQGDKAETQRFLDRAERYYAVGVIIFTLLLIAFGWFVLQEPFQKAFYRAMTAMVVASPCALVISTPASILSAIANGARKGVLFKGGAYLEKAADIDIVAFDKTGTLTEGRPTVTDVTVIPLFAPSDRQLTDGPAIYTTTSGQDIHRFSANEENTLLLLAAAVEAKSEHPLAQAIVKTALERKLKIPEVTGFGSTTGRGVQARVAFMNGIEIAVGSPRLFEGKRVAGIDRALTEVQRLQDAGKTSVIVAKATDVRQTQAQEDYAVLGVIAIADVLRPGVSQVVKDLKSVGVKYVAMLTGDNVRVAKAIGAQAGVDDVFADLLPVDKVAQIKRLMSAPTGADPTRIDGR